MKTLIALLMLTAPALADAAQPPARWHAVFIGAKIIYEPPMQVAKRCAALAAAWGYAPFAANSTETGFTAGCQLQSPTGVCTVVMLDRPYTYPDGWHATPKAVYEHEVNGHCVGWPAHHPR